MKDIFEEIFKDLMEDKSVEIELPPKAFKTFNGKIIDYIPGESLTTIFPINEAHSNPAGMLLGGMLPVFIDMTMGPFSTLETKSMCLTLDLNTTYLKPVFPKDKYLRIVATIIKHSKNYFITEAKVYNSKDDLIGVSNSRMQKQ
ncbi:MAG: PaaI family thioesterase [Chitinophagales bacterium]